MKNVTITLDEDLARRVRVEAAKEGKSVSRFTADLLEKRLDRKVAQRAALEAWLAGPLYDFSDKNGKLPSRDDIYGDRFDNLLRRHERPDLQQERDEQSETDGRPRVDDRAR